MLRAAAWEDTSRWVKPYKMELQGGQPRDPMLPQGVGHYWMPTRVVLFGLGGPARWPLFDEEKGAMEDVYVYDRKGPPGYLRKLTNQEVWILQGHVGSQATSEEENRYRTWTMEGTKATGVKTATSLLTVGGYILFTIDQLGAKGMCRDVQLPKLWPNYWCRWKRGELRRAGGQSVRHIVRWVESWWLNMLDIESEEDLEAEEGLQYAGGRPRKGATQTIGEASVAPLLRQPRPFDGQVGWKNGLKKAWKVQRPQAPKEPMRVRGRSGRPGFGAMDGSRSISAAKATRWRTRTGCWDSSATLGGLGRQQPRSSRPSLR